MFAGFSLQTLSASKDAKSGGLRSSGPAVGGAEHPTTAAAWSTFSLSDDVRTAVRNGSEKNGVNKHTITNTVSWSEQWILTVFDAIYCLFHHLYPWLIAGSHPPLPPNAGDRSPPVWPASPFTAYISTGAGHCRRLG